MAKKRGPGQPPKPANERKDIPKTVWLSEQQVYELESAKDKESPEKRIGAYIRDVAVDHAEKVNRKK